MVEPFFSIIIPTYNRADFISNAIKSCLSQTFQNFEIIVVDDGSSDNTKAIIDSYADARVAYFYQKNGERAAARNHGVSKAKGVYVFFLDSDDYILDYHLEKAFDSIQFFDCPNFLFTGIKSNNSYGLYDLNKDFGREISAEVILDSNVCASAFFLNRDFALVHPFEENRKLAGSEDRLFTLKASKETTLFYAHHLSYVLIDHDDRSMSDSNDQAWKNQHEILISELRNTGHFTKKEIVVVSASFRKMVATKTAISGNLFKSLEWLIPALWLNPNKAISVNSLRVIKYLLIGGNYTNSIKIILAFYGFFYFSICTLQLNTTSVYDRDYYADIASCKSESDSATVNHIVQLVKDSIKFEYRPYTFIENPLSSVVNIFHSGVNQVCDSKFLYEQSTNGFCGQQSKLIADMTAYLGFKYRYIQFDNHIAVEVFYNNAWHFIDPAEILIPLESNHDTTFDGSYVQLNKAGRIILNPSISKPFKKPQLVSVLSENQPFFWKLELFNQVCLWIYWLSYPLFLVIGILIIRKGAK